MELPSINSTFVLIVVVVLELALIGYLWNRMRYFQRELDRSHERLVKNPQDSLHHDMAELRGNVHEMDYRLREIGDKISTLSTELRDAISQSLVVSQRFAEVEDSRTRFSVNSRGTTPSSPLDAVQRSAKIISVRYLEQKDGKTMIEANPSADYFLVEEKDGETKLTVQENKLKKRPSPSHESMLSRFFNIVSSSSGEPTEYELVDPATVVWDYAQGRGWLRLKGNIRQV